jgi:hypothetical protein
MLKRPYIEIIQPPGPQKADHPNYSPLAGFYEIHPFNVILLTLALLFKEQYLLTRKHFLVVFSLIFDLFTDNRKKAVFKPFCETYEIKII